MTSRSFLAFICLSVWSQGLKVASAFQNAGLSQTHPSHSLPRWYCSRSTVSQRNRVSSYVSQQQHPSHYLQRVPHPICINKQYPLGSSGLWSTTGQSPQQEDKEDDGTTELKFWGKMKNYMLWNKQDDGLTLKQRLAKMGVATVLSYGMISNLSYAILVSLSWYGFAAKTGKSPLAPGQWKGFLAFYAGFWMFNNIIRPMRVGFSIAVAPQLDRLVLFFQHKLKVTKAKAITFTVVVVNVIGTTLLMGGGVALASLLAGVPILPAK